MVNINILKIRKKLDKLDNNLLDIIKKRSKLVDLVIKINVILKNIKKKSVNKKIDTKITNKIWKSMIKAYIDYEYRNFDKK